MNSERIPSQFGFAPNQGFLGRRARVFGITCEQRLQVAAPSPFSGSTLPRTSWWDVLAALRKGTSGGLLGRPVLCGVRLAVLPNLRHPSLVPIPSALDLCPVLVFGVLRILLGPEISVVLHDE